MCLALACTPPPDAPALLSATGGAGQIVLAWPTVADNTYDVLRSDLSGGPYTRLQAGVRGGYTDSLPPLTQKYYVVQAVNTGGNSSNSNEASATTAPAAPLGLRITPGATSALLEWTASSGASAYFVYRASGSAVFNAVSGPLSQTSFTDTGLTEGTPYSWQVRAQGVGGPGDASITAQATTGPGTVQGVTLAPGGSVVLVRWLAAPGATGYRVSRASSGGAALLLASVSTTSYADLSPPAGPLRYEVVAFGPSSAAQPAAAALNNGADGDGQWVTAHGLTTFVSDGAEVKAPMDFTTDQWTILQQDDKGVWQRIPGFGSASGFAVFLGVQKAPYWIERIRPGFKPQLYETAARDLDYAHTDAGRPALELIQDDTTGVQVSLTGLSPWHANVSGSGSGDSLELYSQGAWLDAGNDTNLAEGVTAGSMPMTAVPYVNGLASAAAGDITWLLQSADAATTNGGYYDKITNFWSGPLTMKAGAYAPLQVALQPAPVRSSSVSLPGTQYAALSGEMAPAEAPMFWDQVAQYAIPGAEKHGYYSIGPTLFKLDEVMWVPGLQNADRTIPLSWGDPFPADWTRFGYLAVNYRWKVTAPGATSPRGFFSSLFLMEEWSEFSTAPLAPRLGSVQKVTAAGKPLGAALVTGVGASPLIAWQPPRFGTSALYSVHLNALGVSATGGTTLTGTVILSTTATQAQVPPGYLKPGTAYVVSVRAESEGLWGGRPPNTVETAPIRWASSLLAAGTIQP